jgi:hypothetical protein
MIYITCTLGLRVSVREYIHLRSLSAVLLRGGTHERIRLFRIACR